MIQRNVLIACEHTGTVRDAFENAGWNAWSCDIIPTESLQTAHSNRHLKCDITRILNYYIAEHKDCLINNNNFYGDKDDCHCAVYDNNYRLFCLPKFDLLIGFPPCTFLSFAYTGKVS